MNMAIYGAAIAGIAMMAAMMGFYIGRMEMQTESVGAEVSVQRSGRRETPGYGIASPVAGRMETLSQSEERGVRIAPAEGRVYAPASGKVTKLFPQGNAMILRMETGKELLLRVGECRDELNSMFYRPRIVQNEIVNKGKLLLEFDPEQLLAGGENTEVTVCLRDAVADLDFDVDEQENVKVGEEIMHIW